MNHEHYRRILCEARRLIALDPMPDTVNGRRLLLFVALCECYEESMGWAL